MSYSTSGTLTFPGELTETVKINKVAFENDQIIIYLTDYRAIHLSMSQYPWLRWLRQATSEQRSHWEIVPSGGGVWWEELDEGIELQPLLDSKPLR